MVSVDVKHHVYLLTYWEGCSHLLAAAKRGGKGECIEKEREFRSIILMCVAKGQSERVVCMETER